MLLFFYRWGVFSLASFKIFSLSLILSSLNIVCLGVIFFGIHPAWCSLSFLDLWFGSVNNFGKFSVITTTNISSFLSPPLIFPFRICYTSVVVLWFLNILSLFSFVFVFAFQFWKFILTHLQANWFSPQSCPSTGELIKCTIHFCFSDFDL